MVAAGRESRKRRAQRTWQARSCNFSDQREMGCDRGLRPGRMAPMQTPDRRTVLDPLSAVAERAIVAIEGRVLAAYPREACGYVTASGRVHACVNACGLTTDRRGASHPSTAFEFSADDAIRIAESFDGPDPAVILFHSHPDVPAEFSREDIDGATIRIRESQQVPLKAASRGGGMDPGPPQTSRRPAWPRLAHLVVECRADGIRRAVLFRIEKNGDAARKVAVIREARPSRPSEPGETRDAQTTR